MSSRPFWFILVMLSSLWNKGEFSDAGKFSVASFEKAELLVEERVERTLKEMLVQFNVSSYLGCLDFLTKESLVKLQRHEKVLCAQDETGTMHGHQQQAKNCSETGRPCTPGHTNDGSGSSANAMPHQPTEHRQEKCSNLRRINHLLSDSLSVLSGFARYYRNVRLRQPTKDNRGEWVDAERIQRTARLIFCYSAFPAPSRRRLCHSECNTWSALTQAIDRSRDLDLKKSVFLVSLNRSVSSACLRSSAADQGAQLSSTGCVVERQEKGENISTFKVSVSASTDSSREAVLCHLTRAQCVSPLVETKDTSRWFPTSSSLLEDCFPMLRLLANNGSEDRYTCALRCEAYSRQKSPRTIAVFATSCITSVVAIFAMTTCLLNFRSIQGLAMQLLAVTSVPNLASSLLTLYVIFPSARELVMCRRDGSLQLYHRSAPSACSTVAAIDVASKFCTSAIFLGMMYAWHRLSNDMLELRKRERSRVQRWERRVIILVVCLCVLAGIAVADISVFYGELVAQPESGMCVVTSLKMRLLTAVLCLIYITALLALLVFGARRYLRLRSLSKSISRDLSMHVLQVQGQRLPSESSSKHVTVCSDGNSRTMQGLEKLHSRFLVLILIIVLLNLSLLFYVTEVFTENAALTKTLQRYTACLLSSCSPTQDCGLIVMPETAVFVSVFLQQATVIVLSTWAFDRQFWPWLFGNSPRRTPLQSVRSSPEVKAGMSSSVSLASVCTHCTTSSPGSAIDLTNLPSNKQCTVICNHHLARYSQYVDDLDCDESHC